MSKTVLIQTSVVFFICLVLTAAEGMAERGIVIGPDQGSRVALVIGNADYDSAPLKNPVNDAQDMADVLRDLGFEVIKELNAERQTMEEAVERFYRRLNAAQAGFLYYAGHGVQIEGNNYLLPVDIRVSSSADIKYKAVKTDWILAKMEDAKSRVNIVVLDACRDNPFRGLRGAGAGLAPIQSVRGSFIAYATAPGSVARDGSGRNGIYTKHLLQTITTPGLTVEEIFRNVRKGVAQETNFEQIPWDSSSLMGAFYLAGGSDLPTSKPISPKAKTGSLLIWSEPEGAVVYVDGKRQGQAPVKVSGLKPESYRVEARQEGYVTASRQVRVRVGSTAEATLRLEPARQVGRLYVTPDPSDARVRIMNIVPKYHDGIELEPGKYHIRVDKKGYETEDQWVDIAADEKLDVAIELEEIASTGRLFVRTTPPDAKVRLLNSDKVYRDGMELKAGRYRIEVSKSGYKTVSQWLRLSKGEEKQVRIGLERSGPRPGEPWTEPLTGMEFVWVPGGCYEMGCGSWTDNCDNNESPVHEVCVDGFWMGKTEVTIDEYRTFLQTTDQTSGVDWDDDDCPIRKGGSYVLSRNKFGRAGNQPMVEVSWHGAVAFADWLSRETWKEIRLPTEAEWEYAARSGGKRIKYPLGNSLGSGNANCDGCGSRWDDNRTAPVGSFSPNDLGLYDMSGNVREWCRDAYDSVAYTRHSRNNPVITSGGSYRVNRGGCWVNLPWNVRAADRGRDDPDVTDDNLGFRLCFPRVR